MTEPCKGLAAKLVQVLKGVQRVPKNGRNTFQNYDYTTQADAIEHVRPLLAEAGLALLYDCLEVQDLENARVRVKVQYTLIDSDSGESKATVCYGEARDADRQGQPQDKGLYKAITGANKYWLFQTFMISTGDDPENEHSGQSQNKNKAQQAKPSKESKPGCISDGQKKRMFAIANQNGFNQAASKGLLKSFGFESSDDVTKAKYDEVIQAFEKGVQGGAAA